MGKVLASEFPKAREVFEAADDALGFRLSKLCFEGPEEDLRLTANTQPAILTTSIAVLRVVESETGVRPDVCAGHSLGEISALVCAGALSFPDAVRLTRLRGQAMQEAVPPGVGAMAAVIGCSLEKVEEACREARGDEVVAPANLNGGGQIVIAGHTGAVERAARLLKERGAKLVKMLAVSGPFHTVLMEPAARRLEEALKEVAVGELRVPVVTNVEAAPNQDSTRVKELLVRQVTSVVRWEESVQRLREMGVTTAYELGPGTVLAGLCKRIAPEMAVTAVSEPSHIRALRA